LSVINASYLMNIMFCCFSGSGPRDVDLGIKGPLAE